VPVVATASFADVPAGGFLAAVEFWRAVTGDNPGEPTGRHGEFQPLQPVDADPWCYLQRTERPAGTGGASVEHVHNAWTVLRDPVGLTYCITDRAPGS